MESLIQRGIQLPERVYKYCSIDIGSIILKTCEIKMSDPANVNDDLDFTHSGYSNISLTRLKEDARAPYYYHIACEKMEYTKSYEEWVRYINQIPMCQWNKIKTDLEQYSVPSRKNLQKKLSEMFCFTSFSEYSQSDILFERYADNSTGISIGFDTKNMADLGKVSYFEKILQSPYVSNTEEISSIEVETIVKRILFSKHKDWNEEAEWRFIKKNGNCQKRANGVFWSFSADSICKIFFASKANASKITEFKSQIKEKYPNLGFES